MPHIASTVIGAVVGLISVAIFALILRRISDEPKGAIKLLRNLVFLVLGGGLFIRVIDFLLHTNGIAYYLTGLGAIFLPTGLFIFFDWLKNHG